MRDGIRLRVNVFRPDDDERHPVLLCAHPYGKDHMPLHHKTRHGYRPTLQYRLMRSAPLTHSAWTTWEAPDPAPWLRRGYVVINADLRGWGTSEGEPDVMSEQEGLDIYDLVEWAAQQPWSTGRVGMSGVSYLAVSQWIGAATRPPHLCAICPWEAFTDFYRDFARPGGILETGFLTLWGTMTKRGSHGKVDVRGEAHDRPLFDDWYAARNRNIEAIEVPALVCGSFSDHNLHSRGSFEGFRRIGSAQKWLYTHRQPKWQAYYSAEGLDVQARFFDHFLKGEDTGITEQPPVRLEIREDRTTVAEVRHVRSWPPPETKWRTLRCRAGHRPKAGTLEDARPGMPAAPDDEAVSFHGRGGRASFTHRFAGDTNVVGPMLLMLTLSVYGPMIFRSSPASASSGTARRSPSRAQTASRATSSPTGCCWPPIVPRIPNSRCPTSPTTHTPGESRSPTARRSNCRSACSRRPPSSEPAKNYASTSRDTGSTTATRYMASSRSPTTPRPKAPARCTSDQTTAARS